MFPWCEKQAIPAIQNCRTYFLKTLKINCRLATSLYYIRSAHGQLLAKQHQTMLLRLIR
jgi:hypothetical protein